MVGTKARRILLEHHFTGSNRVREWQLTSNDRLHALHRLTTAQLLVRSNLRSNGCITS